MMKIKTQLDYLINLIIALLIIIITDVVNHYKISDDDNIDIEALNDIPLKDLNKAQIASAFVYEAKHKNKGYVKKRSHE